MDAPSRRRASPRTTTKKQCSRLATRLIARLAAIVPPPRWHLIRYHGVLAANASEHAEVVPMKAPQPTPGGEQLSLPLSTRVSDPKPCKAEPSRHPWSWLLMRVLTPTSRRVNV